MRETWKAFNMSLCGREPLHRYIVTSLHSRTSIVLRIVERSAENSTSTSVRDAETLKTFKRRSSDSPKSRRRQSSRPRCQGRGDRR